MSSLSYVTTAGSRRKRKNAVDMNFQEAVEPAPRGKGRPSKGGAALRAKRYYVKNHLMVLEKRKLKRYIVKVRKYIDNYKCDSSCIMAKLKDLCEVHIRRHFQGLKESHLLYFINLSREDQYLAFLNVEGQSFMDSIYKGQTDIPQPDELQELQAKIMQKHSMLLFQFCTLFSAYLLAHHVEKLLQDTTFETNEARLEKMKSECLALYVVRYDHIVATYKDEEDQSQEEKDEQNKNPEENKENEVRQENEKSLNETEQNEAEQQDVEAEQQDEDYARSTDVSEIIKDEQQEEDSESSSDEEPAAKKLKTEP
ncbi:hypothetical protein MAM1_0003c00348 [Mucor ambiguus]|uniref:Uncharacterized protein n=1 Tax=Mucor ambiguus TaxID=91626 RepID=A0A0C9LZU9_9FUNG|nr:hypothetical protein MAM1_0003c00348 [Mucor ambiguus]